MKLIQRLFNEAQRKKAGTNPGLANGYEHSQLEVELESELELPRIIRRRREAKILSATCSLAESHLQYRTDWPAASLNRLNRLKPSAISSRLIRSSNLIRRVSRTSSEKYMCVMPILRPRFPLAGKTPVEQSGSTPVWQSEPSGRTDRPLVRALEIAVRIAGREDIERPAGADLDDRSERKPYRNSVEACCPTPVRPAN